MSYQSNPYYTRYQEVKRQARGSKASPERLKQNALSGSAGWVEQPKDFDWLEKNIPCQAACPAGTDIPGYLEAIAQGRYDEAYLINLRDNVFPAVLGRVCTRPCEPACRHGWEGLGEPVAICFSKRSAADFLKQSGPVTLEKMFPASGKRIAVIGAGAAGLSAARELALLGHETTVLEQHEEPGGMMVQGIPEFRLPREVIRREIEQVRLAGVSIECGVRVGPDRSLEDIRNQFDAVVVAAGTMKPHRPDIPGVELPSVLSGLAYLQAANGGKPMPTGNRVLVIGGGFTAVDCARMAKRLGADDVKVAYRRTVSEMYISGHEIEEMDREGVVFEPQVMPTSFASIPGRAGIRVSLARTEPGPTGADGRRGFREVPGRAFELEVDLVLLATGQERDTGWLQSALPGLELKTDGCTSDDKIFVAGDYLNGAGSLIDAVASGKACARVVDQRLTGNVRLREAGWVEDARSTGRTRDMDTLPRHVMPVVDPGQRGLGDEVEMGFDEKAAREEASRCYLCNYKFEIDNDLCIYCDRCLKVKPMENCIVKVDHLEHDSDGRIAGYKPSTSGKNYNMLYIDQSQCIRCGACRDVCPVECISLQKVSKVTISIP